MKRAAVVVNPTKTDDMGLLRAVICDALREHGWQEPLWLETTADDPGRGQAAAAIAAGVDVVLACGGDGTVTACAEGVAGSGVPLAIIPAGTGNLLARNVRIPATTREAVAVALTGCDQALDSGTVNGALFVVMAGLGLDARMLADTSEPLKKRLGWLAYGLSAIGHLRDRPMRLVLVADGGRPVGMRASAVIVGTVGWLCGGLPLLPDATPDDGMLDAVVLTARGLAGWAALVAGVLVRRGRADSITRFQFRELEIALEREQLWEADGEVMGLTSRLLVRLNPGKLLLRVPL